MSSMKTLEVIVAPIRYDSLADFTDPVPIVPDNYLETALEQESSTLFDDITCEFPAIVIDDGDHRQVARSSGFLSAEALRKSFDLCFLRFYYKRSVCLSLLIGAIITAVISAALFNSKRRSVIETASPMATGSSYLKSTGFNSLSSVHTFFPGELNIPAIHRKPKMDLNAELTEEYAREQETNSFLRPMYVLPVHGELTSAFSYRWGAMHTGIDIAAPIGTPILSVSDGTVIEAGPVGGFGMWVRVLAEDGTVNVYGHVNSIDVTTGQHVLAGQRIATVGMRGFSTGPHLHFEVWLDGKWKVDPASWLAKRGISLGKYEP